MSVDARARLAGLVAAAGYHAELLVSIAHAALPRYEPGTALDDPGVREVTRALEILTAAGHDAPAATALITRHRDHGGEHWRTALWDQALREANARHTPAGAPHAP